jgi:phospholipid transport system substrate-binding protein
MITEITTMTAHNGVRASFNTNAGVAPRTHRKPRAAAFGITVAISLGILGAYTARAATPNDPAAAVKATIDEASPVFADTKMAPAEREQKLRDIAARRFDFTYMARSAMGTHWKSLTPAQRKEFVPLFTDYVMDTYLGTLQQNTVEAAGRGLTGKVKHDGSDLATVYSMVKLPTLADPLHVDYSLRKDPDGWKLYDIVVDNVSTMANYRDEFNKTMNGPGYSALIAKLKQRTTSPTH